LVKDGFLAQRSLILTRLKAICLKLEKQLSDLKPSQYLVSGGINQAFIFVSEVIPELVPQLDILFDKEGSVEKMNQKGSVIFPWFKKCVAAAHSVYPLLKTRLQTFQDAKDARWKLVSLEVEVDDGCVSSGGACG
jgi:hypothetical protein